MIWQLIDSSGLGGAERHVATLSSSLQRRGADVRIILLAGYPNNLWLEQLAESKLRFNCLDGTFRMLRSELRRTKPELIHTHGYKAGLYGRLAGALAGIPVVSTFHSGERSNFPVAMYEFFDEWTSLASYNIAVGPKVAGRLPWSSNIVPSYVALPPYPIQAPLPRSVAFIGRLSDEKGPVLFCQLAARAPPGLDWHVYGDGPLRKYLCQRYTGAVKFHGAISNLDPVWPSIGLIVMPSRFEGIPLTALEALARGIPVLATNVGGMPDLVTPGITGWLFEAGDLETAAKHVEHWRNLTLGRQLELRSACYAHIKGAFSEAIQFPKLLSVYRRAGLEESSMAPIQNSTTSL